MSTKLKYKGKGNVFVVDKFKNVRKHNFFRNFVVHLYGTHDQDGSLPWASEERTAKMDLCRVVWCSTHSKGRGT
jgi:hypothetical protein